MIEESKNQSQSPKSPQDELDELLRQSKTTRPSSGIKLPESRQKGERNWLGVAIAGLAVILIAGTGYFLLNGIKFSTGEVILGLNQNPVALSVDDKSYGQVSNGDTIRLKVGQHTLVLTKDGFLNLTEIVEVSRSQPLTVNLELLPTPEMTMVVDHSVSFARLNQDGSEIAYLEPQDNGFRTVALGDLAITNLFKGSFSGITDVIWSKVGQTALVKLNGRPSLSNMLDNRVVKGRYIPLGTPGGRPDQAPAKPNGTSTWLFDDSRKPTSGWQPILLNESVRQVAFSADGSSIIYIYETADGEYSLVRAWPDGLEWERLIVEMPRLENPQFTWGPDDRYVLIQAGGKLVLLDLVAKTMSEPFPDYVEESQFAFSTDGAKVAYLAKSEDDTIRLKTYDFLSGVAVVVEGLAVNGETSMVWTTGNSLMVATSGQAFELVNVERGTRMTIPVVGEATSLKVEKMEYSLSAKVLMLVTDVGVSMMRV